MFVSNYIPVNMKRNNCAIYSSEKTFPESRLIAAYSFITGHAVEGVYLNEGNISFVDSPETNWTYPEIMLAYNAYEQAAINNFSFYVVKNKEGIPQLFISKAFKGHRILVNAHTMHSVLLGNKSLVDKAASLIDKTESNLYCMNLFDTLRDIETGSAKFLNALLVDKGTPEECMLVNPMTTLLSETTTLYGADLIEEFKQIRVGLKEETESVKVVDGKFIRKEFEEHWAPMPVEHIDNIISLYDKVSSKKSNYMCIHDSKFEPLLYFSTNHRYLVDARTFECLVVKNQHTRNLLIDMVQRNNVSASECFLAWMLAKTE